jgi:hypothetical protein
VLDKDFSSDVDDSEATLLRTGTLEAPVDATGLTNSSIRLGIRGDDAWGPRHVLLFGQLQPEFEPGRLVAVGMETDLTHWLSTDSSEGHLTMPIQLVVAGSSTTLIQRVLLLVHTMWLHSTDTESDSPIELEVMAGGTTVLKQEIVDTPQPDLEAATSNWYELQVLTPFTRADVLTSGGITLHILGRDAWRPMWLYAFGLDTATGRPNEVVTLVAEHVWSHGWMSKDTTEGVPSVNLTVEGL